MALNLTKLLMVASAIQLSANHIVDARKESQSSGGDLQKDPQPKPSKPDDRGKKPKPDNSGKKPQPDIDDGSSKKPPKPQPRPPKPFGPKKPSDIGYFAGRKYASKSGKEKLNDLWQQCLSDDTVAEQDWQLDSFFTQRAQDTFNRKADELPRNRSKITHAQGVVALVSWVDLENHKYTGLYEGGSDLGLIRMSESNFLVPESTGLSPSLAMKFMRDGMESVNQLANVSFDSSKSWNFFHGDFRTRVQPMLDQCAIDTIQRKLLDVSSRPQSLGLSEFSRFKTDGTEVKQIEFPFDIWFEPHAKLLNLWPEERSDTPFYEQLKEIPEGSIMFEVHAQATPETEFEHIGDIKLNSAVVTSDFGDKRLFFQHEKMDSDFIENPQWRRDVQSLKRKDRWGKTKVQSWPSDNVDAEAMVRGSMKEFACPFAWLLDEVITPVYNF